jgi:hypothetical protein
METTLTETQLLRRDRNSYMQSARYAPDIASWMYYTNLAARTRIQLRALEERVENNYA